MAKVGGVHGQDNAKEKWARNETRFREKHGIKNNHGHQKKLPAEEQTEQTKQTTAQTSATATAQIKPVEKPEEVAAPKTTQPAEQPKAQEKDPLFGFVADTIAAADALDSKKTEFIA